MQNQGACPCRPGRRPPHALPRVLGLLVSVHGLAACSQPPSPRPASPAAERANVRGMMTPPREAPEAPAKPALPAPAPEVLAWLRQSAVPLASTDPDQGFADLEPLRAVVGDARIVSLGEATHGTREFFRMKHRLLEFLVERMGFTGLAMEALHGESQAVDAYVMGGPGDAHEVVAGMRFWTWNTEEVVELVRWMRRYNQDPRHERKLHFYGFDMQTPTIGAQALLAYLGEVDPAYAAEAARVLAPLDDDFNVWRYRYLPTELHRATAGGIADIVAHLEAERARYERRAGAAAWSRAHLGARVLGQAEAWLRRTPGELGPRERAMADNVKDLLEMEGASGKLVLWAHNGHVANGYIDEARAMGSYLKEMYGPAYVNLGLVFHLGSFQVLDQPVQEGRGIMVSTVPPAPEGSLDATLAKVGLPLFLLPLAQGPTSGPVAMWLDGPHPTRLIGASLEGDSLMGDVVPRRAFAALVFIERSTPARGNRDSWVRPPAPAQVAAELVNAGFGDGPAGAPPTGWQALSPGARIPYQIALAEGCPRRGQRCVVLRRERSPWNMGYGQLSQRIDAAPWRGRRVRLRALARAEVARVGSEAQLFLEIHPSGDRGGAIHQRPLVGLANLAERPIVSPTWRSYEIESVVPASATSLTLGFVLTGDGRAEVAALSFEALGERPARR